MFAPQTGMELYPAICVSVAYERGSINLNRSLWSKLMYYLTPDRMYSGVGDIDVIELYGAGISGIIADLDNTLITPGAKQPDARMVNFIDAARDIGFDICLLSNSSRRRVVRVSSGLGIYAVAKAGKPSGAGFIKAMRLLGRDHSRVCVIGDQLFTDVLGAKRFGIMAIYTAPFTGREEITVKLKRLAEYFIFRFCLGYTDNVN